MNDSSKGGEMKDDEHLLLNDPEYTEGWVEQEIARSRDYFFKEVLGEEETE